MITPRIAVIPAAGYGSRLDPEAGHKLLVPIGSRTLLAHHAHNFRRLGVNHLVVVTGYRGPKLREAVELFSPPEGLQIHCAHNPDFDGENGRSVLAGVELVEQIAGDDSFWLSMSDHLYDPAMFDGLIDRLNRARSDRWEGALFVDAKLESIFDMPDATKVRLDDGDFAIGKQIDEFDVVDTGLFWCDAGFVEALRAERRDRGDCSTSDAVRRLNRRGRFGFVDVGEHLWQDVDTPAALDHARTMWRDRFSPDS